MSLAFLLRRQAAKGAISTCLRAHCIKIDVSVMGSISPGQFPSSFSVTQSSLQSLSGCFQPNDPNWGGLFSRGFAAGSSGKETETVGEVAESAIKPVKAGAILQVKMICVLLHSYSEAILGLVAPTDRIPRGAAFR